MEHLEIRACPATLSLGPGDLHVAEGGVATLQVTTSQPSMQPTPFTFRTVSGTAIGGTDYQDIPNGSGTIQPYATIANISIQAIEDYFTDIGETFTVELLTASGATINPAANSATVTIDNVAPGGGGGGGGSATLTMSVPEDVDEGEGFLLTVQLSTPGTYQINAAIDWGATPGAGPAGFSGTTNPDGTFTIGHQYFDDGPAPGNGTPQDVQTITLTGSATQYTMQGPVSIPLSGMISTTIHNVAPEEIFDIYNYMPIGGPSWVVSGAYQDVGLADKGTITIDWGDGSEPLVFADVSTGFSFSTLGQPHRYPPEGLSYTITVTITDDDTGSVSYSETAPLYLLDLDNDANNNGEINAIDEGFEPPDPGPGRYISVNADDDNEDGIADMEQAGPISGEDDLEPFLVRWRGDMRPDIQNYYGWHLTLEVPHSMPDANFLNPRIWLNPDKSGGQLDIEALAPLSGGYGKEWTIGAETIPEMLYLEARQNVGIGLQLHLWTPPGEGVEADFIAFTALPPPKGDLDIDSDNTGTLDLTLEEDGEEEKSPGKILLINDDDDNLNGVPDLSDTNVVGPPPLNTEVPDNDLAPMHFNIDPQGRDLLGYRYTIVVQNGSTARLWLNQFKDPLFPAGANGRTIDEAADLSGDLAVEGLAQGRTTIKLTLYSPLDVVAAKDIVLITVIPHPNLIAYTPQTPPFVPRSVPPEKEGSPGVGIRRNGDNDDTDTMADNVDTNGVASENDLIQVDYVGATVAFEGVRYRASRSNMNINQWNDKNKGIAGSALPVLTPTGGLSGEFYSSSVPNVTGWIEWATMNAAATEADLTFTVFDSVHHHDVASDSVTFHPFNSMVVFLSGEFSPPSDPAVAGDGLAAMAVLVYADAYYDTYFWDEDDVAMDGSGIPYDEIVNGINLRGVSEVAIIGYSHGGGSAYNLSWRLDDRSLIDLTKPYTLSFTGYIDAISQPAGVAETRRPVGSVFHVNFYETYLWPVFSGAPSGGDDDINVTEQTWGANLTHLTIYDSLNVRSFLLMRLYQRVAR